MPKKILIVSESRENCEALSEILNNEYSVLTAEDCGEAYSMLVAAPYRFSVVISDLMMADDGGYELIKKIRKSGFMSHIPVIAAAEREDEDIIINALGCGANNFLFIPSESTLLHAMVKNCILLHENASIANELQNDKLTKLYNRNAFMKEVKKLVQRHEAGFFIISSFNINRFKVINDQYGAEMGDAVLRHIGSVFSECFDEIEGISCRIADDRFAILFPAKYENSEKLKSVHSQAMRIEGLAAPISFTIGRYIITDISLSPSIMYDRAVLAAETIKGNYGNSVAHYDEKLREKMLYEQEIVTDMERALESGEFEPWFQPQYNHSTGAMIGSEALVRWRKNGAIVSPNDFIGVFEKNGFIYQVDKYVWRQVCILLRRWIDKGENPLPVSVNVSRYDVFQKDCIDIICGLTEEFSIPKELLRIEITESAFSESPRQIVETAEKLVENGFVVEIDDFGSGYSSLNTLKDVPAQILKLDMRFLESSNSLRGGNIIESIVRMAKWLGMSVIAEGVETAEHADYLASVGCSYIQGYIYAKPMPADKFEEHFSGAEKEKSLNELQTVENLDNNTFWDPKSMETLIFNSYVGAACIFEYHNGKIELIRINRKYAETFLKGASIEKVFKNSSLKNMDSENKKKLTDAIERAIETNDEAVCETSENGMEGGDKKIYIRSTIRVIARSGSRYLLYGTIINTTEQRVAEEKERRHHEEMHKMMADMPGGFVRLCSEEGKPYTGVYCNEGFCKLMGIEHDELFRRFRDNPMAGVHPDDIGIVREAVSKMLKNGEAHSSRYRIINSGGQYIWVTVFGRYSMGSDKKEYLNLYYTDETAGEREDRQRETILDNIPWGVGLYALKDGEMSLIYQNKSYWKLVGLYKADFPDPMPMSAIHPDDIPAVMQGLSDAIEHSQDVVCDIRLRHLKLGYRPVRLVARVVPHEEGFLIIATFVPNEQVEMSYRKTVSLLLATIMEASNNYVFAKDKDLRYICCSPAFFRLAGLEEESGAIGKTDFDLFPKEMAEQFRKNDLELLESGKPMVDFDETIYSLDGEPHFCLASKRILRDITGDGIGIYGVSRDITKEHTALEQLRLINDGVPGGIVNFAIAGDCIRITYCSDGFCRLFGETQEEIKARENINFADWVFNEDLQELLRRIDSLTESGTPLDFIFRIHTADGKIKSVNGFASSAEKTANSIRLSAFLLDITERRSGDEKPEKI